MISSPRESQIEKYYNSLKVSCHHGASNYPNVLKHAKTVISSSLEINIVEIDFITYDKDVISSHDYKMESVVQGSILFEWIHFVIYLERRVLWIDLKENNFYAHSSCGNTSYKEKFNVKLLFNALDHCRRFFKMSRDDTIDISDYIIIGSQDEALATSVYMHNLTHCDSRYNIICDVPGASYYVWQAILPSLLHPLLLNDPFQASYKNYNYADRTNGWVGIDMSFFNASAEIVQFIQQSSIPLSTHIILYTAKSRQEPPILIDGRHIIMQHDYKL